MSCKRDLPLDCNSIANCADAVLLAERSLTNAGIDSARFEAQLIVALALQVDRTAVIARTAPNPNASQKDELYRLISERSGRVPLAYIRGSQEFYGLNFAVNQATLIPRPETELLVDFAREVLGETTPDASHLMMDIGTGSGCIPIAVLKHSPEALGIAIELSSDALAVARQNSQRIGVSDRLRFIQSNLLDGVRCRVQLIVSNPPYISSDEIAHLQPEVAMHEPRIALDGGSDGLALIRDIIGSAAMLLERGGWLAIECAQGQAQKVNELFVRAGFDATRIVNDLAGIQRVVCGRRPKEHTWI